MHISDGVLSLEVTVVSTIVAFAFFVYSFRNLNNEKIVLASAFSALFFVASFIHIPFGPTQIHLMLLGFIGVFLGSVAIFSISLGMLVGLVKGVIGTKQDESEETDIEDVENDFDLTL